MNLQEASEYNKHGCHFRGKLLVVEFTPNVEGDSRMGQSGAQVWHAWSERAAELVRAEYGEPKCVLLSIPDYVVELK